MVVDFRANVKGKVMGNEKIKECPFWIVVEGDNGTGKDTLADHFEDDGWFVVSRDKAVERACDKARTYSGMDFVRAFLDYNKLCAELALNSKQPALLVRYWPSTINGAYSDQIISEQEHLTLLKKLVVEYPLPNKFIFLTCSLTERGRRVEHRGLDTGLDDMSNARNARYAISRDRCYIIPNWQTLSSEMSPDELYQESKQLLKGQS